MPGFQKDQKIRIMTGCSRWYLKLHQPPHKQVSLTSSQRVGPSPSQLSKGIGGGDFHIMHLKNRGIFPSSQPIKWWIMIGKEGNYVKNWWKLSISRVFKWFQLVFPPESSYSLLVGYSKDSLGTLWGWPGNQNTKTEAAPSFAKAQVGPHHWRKPQWDVRKKYRLQHQASLKHPTFEESIKLSVVRILYPKLRSYCTKSWTTWHSQAPLNSGIKTDYQLLQKFVLL